MSGRSKLLIIFYFLLIILFLPKNAIAQSFYCQPNLGFSEPGNGNLSVCSYRPLTFGAPAILQFSNGKPSAPAWLVIGGQMNPRSMFGGTVVPSPPSIRSITLDANGAYSFNFLSHGLGTSVFAQVFLFGSCHSASPNWIFQRRKD